MPECPRGIPVGPSTWRGEVGYYLFDEEGHVRTRQLTETTARCGGQQPEQYEGTRMTVERVRDFIMARDTFAQHLGMSLDEVREGFARATMPVDDRHRNGVGLVHGGAIFALADLAFAAAANTSGVVSLSLTASISFLNAGRKGPLAAEAREISATKRIATYEVRVLDGEGTLLALCQATAYRKSHPIPEDDEEGKATS